MSKNWKFGNIGNDVTLAVKPTGGKAGDVVVLPNLAGSLVAYLLTDIATADGPNAAGLATDYASARLCPAQGVVELTVDGTRTEGLPVFATYADGDWTYTTSTTPGATRKVHIGHVVAPQGHTPGTGNAFVFLGTAGTVAAIATA